MSAPGQPPPALPGNSSFEWAIAFLTSLGAPLCPNNLISVVSWQHAEGGGGANNPLNTTLPMPGSTPLPGNSAGVQNYTGWAQGVQANVDTIKGSPYGAVRASLSQCASPTTTARAIIASPWDGGHYGGPSGSLASIVAQAQSDATFWTQIAGNLVGGSSTNNQGGVPSADAGAANAESDLLPSVHLPSWLSGIPWHRVGMGAGGLLLMVAGAAIFLASTKPGESAIGAAEGIGALA